MGDNYGFDGEVPPGASVADNIKRAQEYRETYNLFDIEMVD
jgi:hypothetical protein